MSATPPPEECRRRAATMLDAVGRTGHGESDLIDGMAYLLHLAAAQGLDPHVLAEHVAGQVTDERQAAQA